MIEKEKNKIKVFLTGATGIMGSEGLKNLMLYPELYDVTILSRDSKKNRKKLRGAIEKGVKVIWGDLLDKESIAKGVKNSDIVLHVGGLVTPEADKYPEKAIKVNIGSIKLICEEVKKIEQEKPEKEIKVVYIGSVSQYGSHLPPKHWGSVGMPQWPAKKDAYAYSKIEAERVLVTSGIKKWVSLRQTAILHKGLLSKANDPVSFHVPLNGTIEWVTVEDSGRILERICRVDVPETFWNNFYNIGGGKNFRLTNYEFEKGLLKGLSCPSPEKIFEPDWFATDNFHGIWFTDSDELEEILKFRGGKSFEYWIKKIKSELPFYYSLTPMVPPVFIKLFMKKVAHTPEYGTLWALKKGNEEKIRLFWGTKENHDNLPDWKNWNYPKLEKDIKNNLKGKDKISNIEEKRIQRERNLNQELSTELKEFTCEKGHRYLSSSFINIRGGHVCPECLKIYCFQ